MKMKKAAILTFLAVLPLFGQQAVSKTSAASPNSIERCPPPPAVVAMFLGFTEGQVQQFGVLLNQFQANVGSLQEQVAARQQQLNMLLSQPDPDPTTVGTLVLQVHQLQQQLAALIRNFQSVFAELLTPDQSQKIEQLTIASQLQPAVGAFVALHLVPPPPSLPCQKQ